jgi:hypothetical protein
MSRTVQLAYILSLPRSGSTVLSVLLDRQKGIISPPESSFPQVLGVVSDKERRDKEFMAALYLEATFVPTPLSLEEAASCMEGDNQNILTNIGILIANKMERNPDEIKSIVWKTPRTVGFHKGPLSTNGKFIILRRNPHNVFESQFRVGFGENNRNPWRFAVFRESYEHALSKIPKERCINVAYDDLPEAVVDICKFLGINHNETWETNKSTLDLAAKSCSWMSEVTSEFTNRDKEKRMKLAPIQITTLSRALTLCRPLRPFLGPTRRYFDQVSMKRIFQLAKARLGPSNDTP